jgi:hypothetical protein
MLPRHRDAFESHMLLPLGILGRVQRFISDAYTTRASLPLCLDWRCSHGR